MQNKEQHNDYTLFFDNNGKDIKAWVPSYRGHQIEMYKLSSNKWDVKGMFLIIDNNLIKSYDDLTLGFRVISLEAKDYIDFYLEPKYEEEFNL